ncbi:unnamed protein product, partial [Rotaria sp. Silwood1]
MFDGDDVELILVRTNEAEVAASFIFDNEDEDFSFNLLALNR